MTVAELSDRMSSRELLEWMAYAELEPFGEQRADLRMGISTAWMVRMWADPKKARGIEPQMFMPYYEEPPKQPKTAQQLIGAFDALTGG